MFLDLHLVSKAPPCWYRNRPWLRRVHRRIPITKLIKYNCRKSWTKWSATHETRSIPEKCISKVNPGEPHQGLTRVVSSLCDKFYKQTKTASKSLNRSNYGSNDAYEPLGRKAALPPCHACCAPPCHPNTSLQQKMGNLIYGYGPTWVAGRPEMMLH